MKYFVTIGGDTLEVDLTTHPPTVDGQPVDADLVDLADTGVRSLIVGGRSRTLVASPGERRGRWEVAVAGERLDVDAVDERTRAIREMSGGGEVEADKLITAPMPGMVVRVEVEVGQEVTAGQGVVVVEAMKMENELKAPADGVVEKVEVAAGQAVEKGQTLVVLA